MEGFVGLLVAFGVLIALVFCLICLKWARDRMARTSRVEVRFEPPPLPPSIPPRVPPADPVLSVPHL